MSFYVFRCPKCGRRNVKENRVNIIKCFLNCKHCGKTSKIKKKFGLIDHNGPYESGAQAAKVCIILNGENKDVGFHTYG